MVDFKPKVNGKEDRRSPISGLASRTALVAEDLIDLAELQAKLAKADAQLATKKVVRPVVALLIGVCGALASLPVLTLGFSAWITSATELETWQSQLIVGAVVAAIAGLTMYLSARSIRSAFTSFERSTTEFGKNIAWLKTVLGKSTYPVQDEKRF